MNKEFDLKQSTKEVFAGLFGIGTVNKTVVVPLKATISLSEVPTVTVGLPVPIPGDFVTIVQTQQPKRLLPQLGVEESMTRGHSPSADAPLYMAKRSLFECPQGLGT